MSAIGISTDFTTRTRVIGAHADYRRTDFVFPRTQSHTMRNAPWDRRMKPMRPWGEITGYAAAICFGAVLATAFI